MTQTVMPSGFLFTWHGRMKATHSKKKRAQWTTFMALPWSIQKCKCLCHSHSWNFVSWSYRFIAASGSSSDPVFHVCADTSFFSFGPGDHGSIEGPSNSPRSECTLTITTCSRCRIRLKITQLDRTRELANEMTRSMARSSYVTSVFIYNVCRCIGPLSWSVGLLTSLNS